MSTNTLHLIGDKFSQLWFFKLVTNWVSSVTSLSAVLEGHEQVWTGVYEESRTNVDTVEKPKVSTPVRNQTQSLIKHFIVQLMHTNYKILILLKKLKL